jgi:hypothetical protein
MKHRTKKKPARRPAPKRAPLRTYFAGQDAPPRLGIVEDALDELDERLEKAESRISWNHWALAGLAGFVLWAHWNKAKSLAFKAKDKGRELVEAAREKMSGDESEV